MNHNNLDTPVLTSSRDSCHLWSKSLGPYGAPRGRAGRQELPGGWEEKARSGILSKHPHLYGATEASASHVRKNVPPTLILPGSLLCSMRKRHQSLNYMEIYFVETWLTCQSPDYFYIQGTFPLPHLVK